MAIKVNMKNIKKKAAAQKERQERKGSGGKIDQMKLGPHKNKILICPPKKKDLLFVNVMVHQVWKGQKPVATAACPRIDDGEECKVCQYGWDSKSKHEESKNKKKASTKKQRTKAEVFELMSHMQNTIGNGVWTRALAWSAGEINEYEMYSSIKAYADALG